MLIHRCQVYLLPNDVLVDIRLLAIDNVTCGSIEWYIEKAYRYYSMTYHTPLHIAKKVISSAEVILIMMEDETGKLTPEQIVDLKKKFVTKHEPMLSVESAEAEENVEMSDEDWVMQQMADLERKEREKKNEKPKLDKEQGMGQAAIEAQKAVKQLYDRLEKQLPNNPEENIDFDIKE